MPPEGGADTTDGRYIHERTDKVPGTRVMRQNVDGAEQVWVHADDFMDVQRERDDYRRTCALLNAWIASGQLADLQPRRILNRVGLTHDDGLAMLSLIESVRSWEADRVS